MLRSHRARRHCGVEGQLQTLVEGSRAALSLYSSRTAKRIERTSSEVKHMAGRLKIQAYVGRLVDAQQERVRSALAQITNEDRHLLAVRGYIRFASRINTRWAMTDDEEAEYRGTGAWRTMQAEVRQIQSAFASSHRGHTLAVNMRARSLDQQIALWNGNDTVLALGTRLMELIRVELDRDRYPAAPTDESVAALTEWIGQPAGILGLSATVLRRRRGRPTLRIRVNTPSNATPGLSSHGQIKALDFVVKRGRATIAGADMGQRDTVWRGPDNWSNRLNAAITSVSSDWDGPLQNPDEPWHYTYEQ